MKLKVGDIELPDDAVTQTFCLFGKRGSGKSNTAVVLAEEMHRAGAPFVVLDPISAWWGLKSSFDGTGPGLPVYVFGGPHGDLPLQPDKGETMARVLITYRQPMVLDMKGWSGLERARFVTAFAEYLLGHNDRTPTHVFLEEADAFIPQRPFKGEEKMLGAMDRLVRWGRQEGVGSTTITQRSAKINKDVTTQTEVLVAHRTTGPQDRDVIRDWIRYHAGGEEQAEILSTLPTLPDGTAWVWSPEWLGILKQVHFRRRSTFDSASTPKLGEKRAQPKELAPVDLERLREQLASTIEEAKENDPRELKRRIATLERQLTTAAAREIVREVPVDREVIVEHLLLDGPIRTSIEQLAVSLREILDRPTMTKSPAPMTPVQAPVVRQPSLRPAPPASTGLVVRDGGVGLGKAERTFLSVMAQFPDGLTRNKLALLAGYKVTSGHISNTLSLLRTKGLIERTDPIRPTAEGLALVDDVAPLPSPGPELVAHWMTKLGKAEQTFLQVLVDSHPGSLSGVEIAERTGYTPTSGHISNTLSLLRTKGLIEGPSSAVKAADSLVGG